jgi:hypothetical protein
MRVPRLAFLLLAMVSLPVAVCLTGCGSDTAVGPPGSTDTETQADAFATRSAGRVTMSVLWPNEDGRRWDYSYDGYACEPGSPVLHASPAEVPPAPAPEDVLGLLGSRAQGAYPPPVGFVGDGSCQAITAPYALRFDGAITTASGVTAQYLRESMPMAAPEAIRLAREPWEKRFLTRLAQARPDLRARLAAQGVTEPAPAWFHLPLFLHGYAWEKTAEYVGTYGDADQALAWKFLAAGVSPGSSFTHQLVPSLADDVFLHGYVVPKNRQWKLKGCARDVQLVYVLDYGVAAATDDAGNVLGYLRGVAYGTVVYAPGVGPVLCAERFGATSDDPSATSSGNVVTLQSVTPGRRWR